MKMYESSSMWLAASSIAFLVARCNCPIAPTVISTSPADGATGVATNSAIVATFSDEMDPLTITDATFTVEEGGSVPITGTVTYDGVTATFTPDVALAPNTSYTATITSGATDLTGIAVEPASWSFTTAAAADTTRPTVISTDPLNAAMGVDLGSVITATFSEAMDPLTITAGSFTVRDGTSLIPGEVTYADNTASFTPSGPLSVDTLYTATVTTDAKDLAGNALAADKVWTFSTSLDNPTPPALGEAARFVILAAQTVTTTGTTQISGGDIGIMVQARTYYTGFTSVGTIGGFAELTGGLSYASDDLNPVPFPYPLHFEAPHEPYTSTAAMLTQANTDLGIAYTFLAADPNPTAVTQVCPAELGGLTLPRGVYKTASNVSIATGDLHLDAGGDPDAVWIFSIDGTLITGAPGGSVILDNGAQAKNVYWRTAGKTVLGAGTAFSGNLFAWSQVNLFPGASVLGRLFAVTEQVTLISNTVTRP